VTVEYIERNERFELVHFAIRSLQEMFPKMLYLEAENLYYTHTVF
jgi:hypothetical protein